MKRTILAVIIATVTTFSVAHAEPLSAQAGRDAAAAKAVASLAAHNMDKAAQSGNPGQMARAQADLNTALSDVRSTARRQQIAQQLDHQAATASKKAAAQANRVAMATAHMNAVTASMSQTPNAPAAQAAAPMATPAAPAAPAAPTPKTQNVAMTSLTPATPAMVAQQQTPAAPAPVAAPAPKVPATPATPAAPTPVATVNSTAPANASINVNVTDVKPDTKVTTPTGEVTTAGAIAAVNPTAQISMPIQSVFSAPAKKGGHDNNHSSNQRGGTGNGGQNAANSRSGMAHGFGDNHVGGGSAQSGSRNVGHW